MRLPDYRFNLMMKAQMPKHGAWDFGDGEISTDQHPEHIFDSQATFNVTLTVTNSDGCQDVAENNIAIVTGIEDNLNSLVTVHPNPSRADKITIRMTGINAKQIDLRLLDVRGHELHRHYSGMCRKTFNAAISDRAAIQRECTCL